jgi:hypothetical protein
MITLVDGDRVETFETLVEAVQAAKKCYAELADNRLPPWNYSIQNVNDFCWAVRDYNQRLIAVLGKSISGEFEYK